ncbi:MAG: ester cyclase [Solirubrobacteraceae bacterium]
MSSAAMTVDEMTERLDQAITAWNRGDLDDYLTLYDDDVTVHGYSPEPMNKAAVKGFYEGIFAGLPGSQIELVDAFGSGARIAARFVQRGRHDGELMGVPATGREVELNGITILAFRDRRVIERWAAADMLGLLVQIGAVNL